MTTPQVEKTRDLTVARFEAEVKEAEARLEVMQAQAKARKAKADMDEISGLAAAKDRVKTEIADMKQMVAAEHTAQRQSVEKDLRALQAEIQRVNERVATWDAARERRFNARLDEAEAKLKVWNAKVDQKRATKSMKRNDDLAALEEKIALARARAAEAKREYTVKAQAALEDAARLFDEAYDAAIRRYEKR